MNCPNGKCSCDAEPPVGIYGILVQCVVQQWLHLGCTLWTRNLTASQLIFVEETCIYKVHPEITQSNFLLSFQDLIDFVFRSVNKQALINSFDPMILSTPTMF
jgi:hypothetical protein